MNIKKYIKQFVNLKYFDLPLGKLKSGYMSFKFGFLSHKTESILPYVYLCNKTTVFDRYFIENYIDSAHVFLKDEVIQKIYDNTLLEDEKQELLENFAELKTALISVVIFPEKNITAFGDASGLPIKITNFIAKTNFDIRFLNLVGSYYSYPIWAHEFRRCNCAVKSQFMIKSSELEGRSQKDINYSINNYMPSSASIYSKNFDINIRSNKRAEGIEQIVYYCVKCKHLFSVYSEFNCLKCRNCGTAIEFSTDGDILLSSDINSLDDIKKIQFDALKHTEFTINPLISFNDVKFLSFDIENRFKNIGNIDIDIFADKISFHKNDFNKEVNLNDAFSIDLLPENIISITLSNGERLGFKGEHKENFYILIDLFSIIKK